MFFDPNCKHKPQENFLRDSREKDAKNTPWRTSAIDFTYFLWIQVNIKTLDYSFIKSKIQTCFGICVDAEKEFVLEKEN